MLVGYITEKKEVTKVVETRVGASCDNCLTHLHLVPDDGALNALNVILSGGFGQFYDGEDIHLLLCQECGRKLITLFPWLQTKIRNAEDNNYRGNFE